MKKIIIFVILCLYVVINSLTASADRLEKIDVYITGSDWLSLNDREKFFYLAGFTNGYDFLATEVLLNEHSDISMSRVFQKKLLDAVNAYGRNKNFTWWIGTIDGFYRRHKKYGSIETRHMISLAVESYIDKITPNIVTKRLESLLSDKSCGGEEELSEATTRETKKMYPLKINEDELFRVSHIYVSGASWNQAMTYESRRIYVVGFFNGYASVADQIEAGEGYNIKASQEVFDKIKRYVRVYADLKPNVEWWVKAIDDLYGIDKRYVAIGPNIMIHGTVDTFTGNLSYERLIEILNSMSE